MCFMAGAEGMGALAAIASSACLLLGLQEGPADVADTQDILVERGDEVIGRLPCERIPLVYPELRGRAEVNAALDSKGRIWAAIGYAVGSRHQDPGGPERLFRSEDGGRTWTSRVLPMTSDRHFLGFTVLADDALLLVTEVSRDDPAWRELVQVHRSDDGGATWRQTCEIHSDPFDHIGEGFLSMTQLSDSRVLLPMARWTDSEDGRELLHSVFVSKDGGQTFPVAHETHDDCHEAHVIELQSGRLLGAFRYQRPRRDGETAAEIQALGGEPAWAHPTTGKLAKSVFKHVWIGASDDGGRTWIDFGAIRDSAGRGLIGFGEAHGQLVQAADGRVVLVHDCRYPYERAQMRARISSNEGRTWEPEVYRLCDGMGYPASVALPDGTILTITGSTRLTPSFEPLDGWRVEAVRWRLPDPTSPAGK